VDYNKMNLVKKLPLYKDSVQLLLFWRWILAGSCAVTALVFEVLERPNLELGYETALDTVILPVLLWVIMTLLAKAITRRSRIEDLLHLHRQLTKSLNQYQDWNELIRFVTKFIGTYVSAERVSLHVYDHREARYEFVAEWRTLYGPIVPEDPDASNDICDSCWRTKSSRLQFAPGHATNCIKNHDAQAHVYCLPLSHSKLLVGILRMRLPLDRTVDTRQVEFIDSIASELALSLALSLAQSRQLAQVNIQAHREERQQVAYELHDSLSQQIAYLHFGLAQLANGGWPADNIELLRQDITQYRDAAKTAYDQMREIISDLRDWEATDLSDAIATCLQRFGHNTRLDIDFTTRGSVAPLPISVCQSIMGVVQESLNNVQRHAHAQRVHVTLKWSIEYLNIEVDDDGVGFGADATTSGHWGLIMMRERINRLAGQFEIHSAPGQGTRLTFTIPLRPVAVI
jgi:signal transduction histidine kinase